MFRGIASQLLWWLSGTSGFTPRHGPDPRTQTYCAYPIAEGTEGRLSNAASSLELVAVTVITRHGQRSAETELPNVHSAEEDYFSCAAEDLEDVWQSLPSQFRIVSATSGDEITRPLRPELLKTSSRSDECAPGQLTAEGFRRQQRLGRYLRAVYPQLLKSLNSSAFYARSTDFTRTIGSGVALLSEALQGWSQRIPLHVNDQEPEVMRVGADLLLNSVTDSSSCPSAITLIKEQQWVPPSSVNAKLKNLFGEDVQKLSIVEWVSEAMDSVIARSCAGLQPPCGNGGCADGALAKDVLMAADQFICKMFVDDQGGKPAISRVMYPFMLELVERLRDDAKRWLSGGGRSFSLYSSHDIVVGPLLGALGFSHEDCAWPGYDSRVVLELWRAAGAKQEADTKGDNDSGFFVRTLYNGRALQSVRGCDEQELCPLGHFAAGVASLLDGAKSFAAACAV